MLYAVAQRSGFIVGDLAAPGRERVQAFAPEGAKLIDAATFDKIKDSPEALRREVLGQTSFVRKIFQAVHIVSEPTARASEIIDRLGSKIASWDAKGRQDSVTEGSVLPDQVRDIRDRVRNLGGYLSKRSTKQAYMQASGEERAKFEAKFSAFKQALGQLSGIRAIGGGLNELVEGLDHINDFILETGMSGGTIRMKTRTIGEATMLFGVTREISSYHFQT